MYKFRGVITGLIGFGAFAALGMLLTSTISANIVEVNPLPGRVDATRVNTEVVEPVMDIRDTNFNGIDVSASPTHFSNYQYVWSSADDRAELSGMLGLVEEELGEYQSGYLEKIGLKAIAIVDNIKNSANQPILGFYDSASGKIYLNSVATSGEYSRALIAEQTIHHEIGHLLAFYEYGPLFDQRSGWSQLDTQSIYGNDHSVQSEYFPVDGFVSRYAMTSASEDYAEAYSLIYTDALQDKLRDEASNSELLSSKLKIAYQMINHADSNQCQVSYQAVDSACH